MPRLAEIIQGIEKLLNPTPRPSPLVPVIEDIRNAFARDILSEPALVEASKNLGVMTRYTSFDSRFTGNLEKPSLVEILTDNGTTQTLDAWARDGLGFGRVPVLTDASLKILNEVLREFRETPSRARGHLVGAITEILEAHSALKSCVEKADRERVQDRGETLRRALTGFLAVAPDY